MNLYELLTEASGVGVPIGEGISSELGDGEVVVLEIGGTFGAICAEGEIIRTGCELDFVAIDIPIRECDPIH